MDKQNEFRKNENIISLIEKSKILSIINLDYFSLFQQKKKQHCIYLISKKR